MSGRMVSPQCYGNYGENLYSTIYTFSEVRGRDRQRPLPKKKPPPYLHRPQEQKTNSRGRTKLPVKVFGFFEKQTPTGEPEPITGFWIFISVSYVCGPLFLYLLRVAMAGFGVFRVIKEDGRAGQGWVVCKKGMTKPSQPSNLEDLLGSFESRGSPFSRSPHIRGLFPTIAYLGKIGRLLLDKGCLLHLCWSPVQWCNPPFGS
ncbi:uncharacterized protein LY89DRAFT_409097 [Mollisia scopiformis]|uniref:Uncharacterized protein n=1 Tax=Mollisia scopiformis TaxID=149040 RepID=A0A132B229_MOLSC|nr:uncharacterized protein LY89DRAFT_409097 [Mollisia scopiformis]KUJ06445.1 hypothetical protein LY89DRAFT_409097 [Mollisia scopiformis]